MRVLLRLTVIAALSWGAPALAQQQPGTFNLQLDNDLFAGTDQHYTNGVRLDWISAADDVPAWTRGIAPDLLLLSAPTGYRFTYSLGQAMYTPGDIGRKDQVRDDRPYAGWLYGAIGLFAEQGSVVDNLQLQLGVVGPASLAEPTQKTVHKLIGAKKPQGWKYQLDNEPGIILSYERTWEDFLEIPIPAVGYCFDMAPRVGAAVGNVMTYAAAGLTARFGKDLPDDFGPPLLRTTGIGAAPRGSAARPQADDGCNGMTGYRGPGVPTRWGWYLFGSLEGRAVAHNIFLDGNTFSDSAHIDKKPLVADLQLGLVVYIDWFKISYSRMFRTREFENQPTVDSYGSIGVAINF